MLVLCQKLHICTYDRQNFSDDWPPLVTHCPLPPKVEGARTAPEYYTMSQNRELSSLMAEDFANIGLFSVVY